MERNRISHTLTRPSAAPAGASKQPLAALQVPGALPLYCSWCTCNMYAVPKGASRRKYSSCRSNRGQQLWDSLRLCLSPADVEDRDKDHRHAFQGGHAPGQLPLPKTSSCTGVIMWRTRCGDQVVIMQEDDAGHALLDRALHSNILHRSQTAARHSQSAAPRGTHPCCEGGLIVTASVQSQKQEQ